MKNGEIKSNKSPKISENGGSSCIDQYQAHQHSLERFFKHRRLVGALIMNISFYFQLTLSSLNSVPLIIVPLRIYSR